MVQGLSAAWPRGRPRADCEDVDRTLARYGDSFSIFNRDIDFRNSLAMSILKIGETINYFSDEMFDNSVSLVPWRKPVKVKVFFDDKDNLRNLDDIWLDVKVYMPWLRRFCLEFMANNQLSKAY